MKELSRNAKGTPMSALRVWVCALLLPLLGQMGCANPPVSVPVAVVCPPFPTPPAQLMTPPTINDWLIYYDTLKK